MFFKRASKEICVHIVLVVRCGHVKNNFQKQLKEHTQATFFENSIDKKIIL
jgi:Zn ribbon nucleic-acid-binding protein